MPMRCLVVVMLLTGGVIALAGAWNRQPPPPDPIPETAFVAQDIELDSDTFGSSVDAGQLLQSAIAKLEPSRTNWLKTKIRQTMNDGISAFVAEGYLQRGPNHCARLEMTITTDGRDATLIVVSDGELLAEIRRLPEVEPKIDVHELPDEAQGSKREAFLNDKSCAGPVALLRQLQTHLRNGRLQTGLLEKTPVIRVKGDLDPDAKTGLSSTVMPACQAVAYLDAKTLWPRRLEWWGRDMANARRMISCIEFTDAEVNRPLSTEACMRAFSYQAEESGR